MKDYQNAVLKMIDEIIKFFDDNPELEKNNAILKIHVDALRALKKDLLANKMIQEADIRGLVTRKTEIKVELAKDNFRLSGSMRSFATDNNNDLLYQEINSSKSDMKRLSDENMYSFTLFVIDKLTEYQEDLKTYGITADDIVNLTAKNKLFHELLLLPAQKRKEVKVSTVNIKQIITKILTLLRESIDNDMLQYQAKEPELYKKYEVLREIDDSQTTALSFKGLLVDAHEPSHTLQYVKVIAKFKAGGAFKEMQSVSSELGNYQFKGIPEGKCTLTFSLEYYDSLVVEAVARSGKLTQLDVELKKTV